MLYSRKTLSAAPWRTESMTKRMRIEIKKIGNSDGLILPRELMQRLDLKRGQHLHLSRCPAAGFKHCPMTPTSKGRWKSPKRSSTNTGTRLAVLAK